MKIIFSIITTFILSSLFLLSSATAVKACSCNAMPTIADSFEDSDEIVVVKVLSIEKMTGEDAEIFNNIKSVKMLIEKNYKGNLKAGDEIEFQQGINSLCAYTFDEKNVGEEILFYLHRPRETGELWIASICGRSKPVERATDDLSWLDNLDKFYGRTRISGAFSCFGKTRPNFVNREIRIAGDKQTRVVRTNKNGVYEIYDLPAGEYSIEPELPFGWKVNIYNLETSPNFIEMDANYSRDAKPKKFVVLLENKKHAVLDFNLKIDNEISGKVLAPNGRPMKGVSVTALPTNQNSSTDLDGKSDYSEENGTFVLREMSPGDYVLAVNAANKLDADQPFGTLFYPGVKEREKAAIFRVGIGTFQNNVNIKIPSLNELIIIEGTFLSADGKPIISEDVIFKPETFGSLKFGEFRSKTDEQGKFSIKIIKNLTGKLFGRLLIYRRDLEKECPEMIKFVDFDGKQNHELKTNTLEITAEKDLTNIDLRLQVSSCEKLEN